jgi:hypothetical protein
LQKRDSAADFLPVKVRILASRSPGEATGFGRKWQSAGDLLEKSWQQFGIFARGAKPGVARSLAFRLTYSLVWRDHGLADVVFAFSSISAGY